MEAIAIVVIFLEASTVVHRSCIVFASLYDTTSYPRNGNLPLLFYRFWGFPLILPVLLVRGAYANPRNGNYSFIFYRFWGLRTIVPFPGYRYQVRGFTVYTGKNDARPVHD